MKNDKNELILALKNEILRLKKIEKMSEEERAPYAAGIEKLRARIDELREATGMTAEGFAARMRAAIGELSQGQAEALDEGKVVAHLQEAEDAWRMGDAAEMEKAFLRIRMMTDAVRAMKVRQEALL